eukprot:2118228-Prymnesium_polylepis.2
MQFDVASTGGPLPMRFDATTSPNNTSLELGACDEKAVYSEQCGEQHASWAAELADWHGNRAAFFSIPGNSVWGIGHMLSVVYGLHDVCRQAKRYCYISLYDMDLEQMLQYGSGHSWAPSPAELGRYRNATAISMDWSQLDSSQLDNLVTQLRDDSSGLVNVTGIASSGCPNLRIFDDALPAMPWEAPQTTVALNSRLTRCYCHFVSAPVDLRDEQAAAPLQAAVSYHLRTGLADMQDDSVESAEGDHAEAARWIAASCPDGPPPKDAHLMSDSPGLIEALTGQRPPFNGTSRSWGAPLDAKRAAVSDVIVASRSTRLFASHAASSFGRPIAARSMCLKAAHLMSDPSAACPMFEAIFPRDYFMGAAEKLQSSFVLDPLTDVRHPCYMSSSSVCVGMFMKATVPTIAASSAK